MDIVKVKVKEVGEVSEVDEFEKDFVMVEMMCGEEIVM